MTQLASVVVPTFNRRQCIDRLLQALNAQTVDTRAYEVIVSVDGSTDGTTELVRDFRAAFPLKVVSGANAGRATACNRGIQIAQGRLIILLDDDMEPEPSFVESHVDANPRLERMGVLGGVPIMLDAGASPTARYIGVKFNRHLRELERAGRPLHFRDFYSGNFSIPRDILASVGGFDESFRVYGNEDLELSWRLQLAGVHFTYCAKAVARQHYTKDFEAVAKDNLSKGKTAVLLATKHPDALPFLRLSSTDRGALPRRLFRSSLLAVTRFRPAFANSVIELMKHLEHRNSAVFGKLCGPVLDYLFWVGALSELRHG
jgi:GT2 family glycosyltransferase